jgi:hypothetical protein
MWFIKRLVVDHWGIDRAEMRKVFGAPVAEQDVDKIIDYLIATY